MKPKSQVAVPTGFSGWLIDQIEARLKKQGRMSPFDSGATDAYTEVLGHYDLTGPPLSAALRRLRALAEQSELSRSILSKVITILEDRAR